MNNSSLLIQEDDVTCMDYIVSGLKYLLDLFKYK